MSKKIMLLILVAVVSVSSLFALCDNVFSPSVAVGYNSRQPDHLYIGPRIEIDMMYPVKGHSISHGLGTRLSVLSDLDWDYDTKDYIDDILILLSSGYSMYWTNRNCRLECNLFIGPAFFINDDTYNSVFYPELSREAYMMYGVGGCASAGFTLYFNKASTFGLYGNVCITGGATFTPEGVLLEDFKTDYSYFATGSIGFKINYRGLMPWDR